MVSLSGVSRVPPLELFPKERVLRFHFWWGRFNRKWVRAGIWYVPPCMAGELSKCGWGHYKAPCWQSPSHQPRSGAECSCCLPSVFTTKARLPLHCPSVPLARGSGVFLSHSFANPRLFPSSFSIPAFEPFSHSLNQWLWIGAHTKASGCIWPVGSSWVLEAPMPSPGPFLFRL